MFPRPGVLYGDDGIPPGRGDCIVGEYDALWKLPSPPPRLAVDETVILLTPPLHHY